MKKIIFSAILAFLCVFSTQAQDVTTSNNEAVSSDDYSKWQVRVRAVALVPAPYFYDSVKGIDPDISTSFAPEIDITYFLSKRIALELMLTTTKHDVEIKGSGTDIGSISFLPPGLSLQYHFLSEKFKPYVGAGLNYFIFYGEDAGDIDSIEYKNTLGYSLQAGVDYALTDKWFINLDFKKIFVNTEVTINNNSNADNEANLDPFVFGFGVGRKF
ncbi:OmpW/AlkL family protein [Psychroserpens sp.]